MIADQNCLDDTPEWALKMLAWGAVCDEKLVILTNLRDGATDGDSETVGCVEVGEGH
jgi:hypothetical protein